MTAQDCMDNIAKKHGWNDWRDIWALFHHSYERYSLYEKEATELYASSLRSELAEKEKEIAKLKIDLSNYAYEADRAKRDRDNAERERDQLKNTKP